MASETTSISLSHKAHKLYSFNDGPEGK